MKKIFCSVTDGLLQKAIEFLSIPILVIRYKLNYKLQIKFFNLISFSMPRQPIALKKAKLAFEKDVDRGYRNIFVNISYLAFKNENSGIPRVAKEIIKHATFFKGCKIRPFYFHPINGEMRVFEEGRSQGICKVHRHDVVLNPIPNVRELQFNAKTIELLQNEGVLIGYILHDIIAITNPEYFKKRDAVDFSRWLQKISYYDFILAVSKTTLKAYEDWATRNQISMPKYRDYFWLGSDFTSASIGENLEIIDGNFALMVGTIEPRKGHAAILRAFEKLWLSGSSLKLVIVGRKGWKMDEFINKLRNHQLLGQKLFWFDNADDEVLVSLYRKSLFCISASYAEGFGLPLVEANYFGKWVLCRDIPIFREIGRNRVLFFDDDAPGSISCKIREIMKMIANDEQSECQIFCQTWDDSVKQICDAMSRMLRK